MMTDAEQLEGLRMINVRNRAYWSGVADRDRQMESKPLMEKLFPGDMEELRRIFLKDQAAKGGKATKADLLTQAIRTFVAENPIISEADLRVRLAKIPDISFLDSNELETNNLSRAARLRYLDRRGL